MTHYLRAIVALVLLIAPMTVCAQLTSPVTTPPSISSATGPDKSMTPPAGETISGSAVDPREYHLGPGDVLQCRFWTSDQSVYPVVTGDQLLVVPRLGEFDVRGKTLADVRDEIYKQADVVFAEAKSKSARNPVTLSLYQPRRILVKVRGDVSYPSVYAFTGATRADVAVDFANKMPIEATALDPATRRQLQSEEQRKRQLESYFGMVEGIPASQRYISVVHPDGSTDRLDLVRYNSIHDPTASPLLRESDVIVVPLRDVAQGSLGVYGAVQSPADFEFVPGDSLSSVIRYAFGLKPSADSQKIELTRLNSNGEPEAPQLFDWGAILAHRAADVLLQRNDRIIVRERPNVYTSPVVSVRGEVAQPGAYAIVQGQTKLSEVIRQAGGLTGKAYPAGGVVLRHGHSESISSRSLNDDDQTSRLENLGVADTGNLRKQLMLTPPAVIVDMERALVQGDHSADIPLQGGDEIVIPQRPTGVFVGGFVNDGGYVAHEPGRKLSFYIERAGGYAEGAQRSSTVVIKYRSKAWMSPGATQIEPGDEVFVPKEPDNPPGLEVQNLAAIGGIGVSLAAFVLGLYNALRKP